MSIHGGEPVSCVIRVRAGAKPRTESSSLKPTAWRLSVEDWMDRMRQKLYTNRQDTDAVVVFIENCLLLFKCRFIIDGINYSISDES